MRNAGGLAAVILMAALPSAAQQYQPEGFGAKATGGEGGQVIHVTTLAAEGPGSLREAIDAEGPRTVVFDVAGTIELGRGRLAIGYPHRAAWNEARQAGEEPPPNPHSHLTIDGTTAPPPGITISGTMMIGYGASDVIIRNLRIRDNGYCGRSGSDCITIVDGCRDICVDHCSLTWARDEVVNPWGQCSDITFGWCIFQGYGPHGYGPLVGGGATRTTIHHCLFAHNMGRNPRVTGPTRPNITLPEGAGCVVDVRNNAIYNWHNVGCTALAYSPRVNVIGNRYIPGPSSDPKLVIYVYQDAAAYIEGNISPVRPSDDMDQWLGAGHLVAPDWEAEYGPWEEGHRADEPFEAPPVTMQPAEEAKDLVLALAGARPRDPIDAGIVRTVLHETGWAGVPNTRDIDWENEPPAVSAQAAGDGFEVTLASEAEDADGDVVGWAWELGDGTVAPGSEVSHRYEPGDHVATVVAMDDMGATGSARLKLMVQEGQPVVAEALPEIRGERLAPPGPVGGEPPLTVEVPRIAAPEAEFPGEAEWQRAARLVPFLMQADQKPVADAEVDARVLHDGERLWARIDSMKPGGEIRPVRPGGPERWFHRSLELCLAPQWGRRPWFHLVVSTNGEVLDAREFDRDWDPPEPWRIESRAEGERWIVEVGIPLDDIGADDEAQLKIAQYRDKDEILIWPPETMPDGRQAVSQMPLLQGLARLLLEEER